MLLSIHETSKALRLSERHIRRMISEGRFPHYRLGHRLIRLDLDEVKKATRRRSVGKDQIQEGDLGK